MVSGEKVIQRSGNDLLAGMPDIPAQLRIWDVRVSSLNC